MASICRYVGCAHASEADSQDNQSSNGSPPHCRKDLEVAQAMHSGGKQLTDLPLELLHMIFDKLYRDSDARYPYVNQLWAKRYCAIEPYTKLQHSSGRLHMVIATPFCFVVSKTYLEAARSFVLTSSFVDLREFETCFSRTREIILSPDFKSIHHLKVPYTQKLAGATKAVIEAAAQLKILVIDMGIREFGFNHRPTWLNIDQKPYAPRFTTREERKIVRDFEVMLDACFAAARSNHGVLFANAIEAWLGRDKEFDFCMDMTAQKLHKFETASTVDGGYYPKRWDWVSAELEQLTLSA
jgi:hypothetical protein